MRLEVLRKTSDPEEAICEAARNDYFSQFVGDVSFKELMDGVGYDEQDLEVVMEMGAERYDPNIHAHAKELAESKDRGMYVRESKQRALIRHLLSRGHFGPFEHPTMIVAVKGVSRSLMAQITRHRHVSFDVQSQRYVDFSEMDPGELIVTPQTVEDVDTANRNPDSRSLNEVINGRDDVEDREELQAKREEVFNASINESVQSYRELRDLGMPPEDARFVLPIGSKVNMVFSLNARMLMHVADMRAQADAQWEVREMTEKVLDEAYEWCPLTFQYYEENMKHRKNRLAP